MSDNDLKKILRDNPLFEGFTEQQLDLVIGLGFEASYSAGKIIIEENEIKDEIYIILEGEVEVYNWDPKLSQRLHLASLGPNQIIGELSILDNIPRSASVSTILPCRLFAFSVNSLKFLPEKKGIFGKWFTKSKTLESGEVPRIRIATLCYHDS